METELKFGCLTHHIFAGALRQRQALTLSQWHGFLGGLHFRQGNWRGAYAAFRRAIELNPRSGGSYVLLGHCLKEMDLYEAAECSYRSAILCGTRFEDVCEHLVFVADFSGFTEQPETLLHLHQAAVQGDPDVLGLPTLGELFEHAQRSGWSQALSAGRLVGWMRRRLRAEDIGNEPEFGDIAVNAEPRIDGSLDLRWPLIEGFPSIEAYPSLRNVSEIVRGVAHWLGRFKGRSSRPVPQPRIGAVDLESRKYNAAWSPGLKPRVSIIVLNHNKAELTLQSIQSVFAAGISVPYELLVVDNGSAATELDKLQAHADGFRLISLPRNLFFGEGNNIGAEAAVGQYVLFLNNDAFLTPGVVEEFLACFEHVPDCGAVGPVFRYPDGRLQEAGAVVNAYGATRQRGKSDARFDVMSLPRFDLVDYVSGACLMIAKGDFLSLGGFNYLYEPAYYEDVDLCLRLLAIGRRAYVARDACCYHVENATAAVLDLGAVRDVTRRQRLVFLRIWGRYLSARSLIRLPDIRPFIDHHGSSQHLNRVDLVVSMRGPLVLDAACICALSLAATMSRQKVTAIATDVPQSRCRLLSLMRDAGVHARIRGPLDIRCWQPGGHEKMIDIFQHLAEWNAPHD